MEKKFEYKNEMEKEIILDSMNNIYQYIKLTNEDTLYFNLFNEYLFENHNKWLDNIKNQFIKGIDNNSNSNINISDINYDDKLINIIKKIVEPHDYKNYKKYNENINNDEILEKIDELTNFNDIVGTINICSESKRKSLLSTIHKKRNNDINSKENNNINYDNDVDTNNKEKDNNDNDNDFNDEDINIKDIIQNNQKEKIINSNIKNEEEDSKSLCTIIEQPSIEDLEKNNTLSQSNNLFNSKQYSFSNQISNKLNSQLKNQNSQNSQKSQNSQNKNNRNNYILDLNNNINNNILVNKCEPNTDNKINYKPLKIIESITTPEKNNNYPLSQSINNNNYLLSNTNSKLNQDNLFNSQQKSPYFANIKNEGSSSNKNNINVNNIGMINNGSQFSFNNSNKNISNFNEFTFSTIKKFDNNLSNNKNYNSSNNKNNAIIIHTSKKNEQDNKNLSNFKNNNDSNNKNFINILTNSINNINNKKIENNNQNNNIEINNNYNNNNQNNLNNNKFIHNNNNFNQNIVLNSIKKNNDNDNDNDNLINVNSNVKIKDKYENDFEEYEMSDSSNKEDDDDEEYGKFIPKWAMDKEYINQQIKNQNNNKELIFKSFGNFVVENLNLNMIFETHNENFDIRNSTADWRGDDSFARNKIINIDDKEIDDMFPNRKLQF